MSIFDYPQYQKVKISIITVVFNAQQYLRDCINSVLAQDYDDIEYILIDGASTDGSYAIAQEFKDRISVLVSEPDNGMYDALNKGIALATGEVVGILNADDMLASTDVISKVAAAFKEQHATAVHGDLNYVTPDQINHVERKWRSTSAQVKDLALGWMPAHPTLYLRRALFAQFGGYSLKYGSAADYELMLRFLYANNIPSTYLPILMVNMRSGGMSNQTLKQRYGAFLNDYKALKHHKIPFPLVALVLKKVRKIKQFF